MQDFISAMNELTALVEDSGQMLQDLDNLLITEKKNKQNRSVKQIIGHMIDSASNNTHRIIRLQYGVSPLKFPDYASEGNNDRWISIQNYQDEDRKLLVNLWKCVNLHFVHVVGNINPDKIDNKWEASQGAYVTLYDMVIDYLRHFKLHLSEIQELLQQPLNTIVLEK